jgi:FkbM family methyltransferase
MKEALTPCMSKQRSNLHHMLVQIFAFYKNVILRIPVDSKLQRFIAILKIFIFKIRLLWHGKVVVSWLNDTKLVITQGAHAATGNYYLGLMEKADMTFLIRFLTSQDRLIDVGANVGTFTLIASSLVGAKSMAFEPVGETYNMLLENIRVNGVTSLVTLQRKIVSDSYKSYTITNNLGAKNRVLLFEDRNDRGSSECIESIMLDDCQYFLPVDREAFTFIKIDVEGHEPSVLRGANQIIKTKKNIVFIVELMPNTDSAREVVNQLTSANYIKLKYDEVNGTFSEFSLENLHERCNAIFIQNDAFKALRNRPYKEFSVKIHTPVEHYV